MVIPELSALPDNNCPFSRRFLILALRPLAESHRPLFNKEWTEVLHRHNETQKQRVDELTAIVVGPCAKLQDNQKELVRELIAGGQSISAIARKFIP